MDRKGDQAGLFERELPGRDEMVKAFMERDKSFDGLFYGAVTTTGVFCKPSCSARKPAAAHLEFFGSAKEALFAGFRPCKRCDPLSGGGGDVPTWLGSLVEKVEREPSRRISDEDLRNRGLDPAAVRRWFMRTHGMTFQAYCRARRLGTAFESIKKGGDLDDAVFDHGWESHSGFRDAFSSATGMPPGAARGSDFIRLSWMETPLGPMVAGATGSSLCLLEFSDRRMLEAQLAELRRRFSLPALPGASPLFDALKVQLDEYFAGKRTDFDMPLEYPGSEFQAKVWDGLRRIPYGQTRSYAGFAEELGVGRAASRAVGRANGENRLAILIPCHRVISADGGLGGYGGGLWRKLRLLEREGAAGALRLG